MAVPPIHQTKHRMPVRSKSTGFYSWWQSRTTDEFWSRTCCWLVERKEESLII